MAATAEPATPADEVLRIIADLCAAVEARSKVSPALVILGIILARLGRLRDSLARLVARISAGKPMRVRKPRPAFAGASPRVRKPSAWPAKYRALGEQLGEDAAQFAARLRAWLADPEAVAYIVANPGIGRRLRPLCRSLGVRLIPELRRKRVRRVAPGAAVAAHISAAGRAPIEPAPIEPAPIKPMSIEPAPMEPSAVVVPAVEPAANAAKADAAPPEPPRFPPPPPPPDQPVCGVGPPDWIPTDPGPSMNERVNAWLARNRRRWQ